jgi:SRSO17 transposase
MTAIEIEALEPRFEAFCRPFLELLPEGKGRGAGCTRRNCALYVRGLLSDLERKSVEPIALASGVDERALQQFLASRPWDHDAMRDEIQRQAVGALPALLELALIDETSHVKKGKKTPGVQRQYCGSVGKVENCIVTVHLAGASADGGAAALLDSDLYVPDSWDAARRKEAKIPADVKPRAKWQVALAQCRRARDNGLHFRWLAADEGYGGKPGFLAGLVDLGQAFAVEIPKTFRGWTHPPHRWSDGATKPSAVEPLVRHSCEGTRWRKYAVKVTTKGPTAWEVRVLPFGFRDGQRVVGGVQLLAARNVLAPEEVKYFAVFDPTGAAPEAAKVRAAFGRPAVEEAFKKSKGELGLSHYEGRTYSGLIRHCHLAALALLFLEIEETDEREKKRTGSDGVPNPSRHGRAAASVA